MKFRQFKEGKVKFFAPVSDIPERAPVFYNPEAEILRDISVSALQVYISAEQAPIRNTSERSEPIRDISTKGANTKYKGPIKILDAMSATGIAGLRYAKEVKIKKPLFFLVDKNPVAIKLIKKNLSFNKISKKNTKVLKSDVNKILYEHVFAVIDIDPFGTPAHVLDSAARSIWHRGFLMITATDQAPLCGTYPEKCFKLYGITPIQTEYFKELGLRILLSKIILECAKYDRAFIPVLSIAYRHYFRIYGKIIHAGEIYSLLNQFKYIQHCSKCGNRQIQDLNSLEKICQCKNAFQTCGPIYIGKLHDKEFCKKILQELKKRKFKLQKKEEKLLNTIISELDSPFYYDLHKLSKLHKFQTKPTEYYLKKLKSTRTHFCKTGIKTNLSLKEIKKKLRIDFQ